MWKGVEKHSEKLVAREATKRLAKAANISHSDGLQDILKRAERNEHFGTRARGSNATASTAASSSSELGADAEAEAAVEAEFLAAQQEHMHRGSNPPVAGDTQRQAFQPVLAGAKADSTEPRVVSWRHHPPRSTSGSTLASDSAGLAPAGAGSVASDGSRSTRRLRRSRRATLHLAAARIGQLSLDLRRTSYCQRIDWDVVTVRACVTAAGVV